MRQNIAMFMADHFIDFVRKHLFSTILIAFFITAPAVIFGLYNSNAFANANLIRDTQLLLSLNGVYNGPIDGQCNTQTKQAITDYQTRFNISQLNDSNCGVELLNAIKSNISIALTKSDISTNTTKEIDEIKASIKNTNAAVKGLTDGFASNFLSQYNSLASSGLSAFIAAISGTIAIIGLASALLKDFIKGHIDSHTSAVVSKASAQLQYTADIAHTSLATHIYARLGGRILYSQLKSFYNDDSCPEKDSRRERYMAYLEGGAHISTIGNDSANALLNIYQDKPVSDADYSYINACKNNFIFYVASLNDVYFHTDKTEERIKNVGDVAKVIMEFEEMISARDKQDYLLDNRETIIWARLCLGIITGQMAKDQIESLIRETPSTEEWRKVMQTRYAFYDRFPEHKPNMVGLGVV